MVTLHVFKQAATKRFIEAFPDPAKEGRGNRRIDYVPAARTPGDIAKLVRNGGTTLGTAPVDNVANLVQGRFGAVVGCHKASAVPFSGADLSYQQSVTYQSVGSE